MDTGWHRGRFRFDPARHDDGPKRVLGVTIPAGGGVGDGERVLDLLAAHPATARHLSHKLCVHFLGHAPDAWVARLSAIYPADGRRHQGHAAPAADFARICSPRRRS